MLDWFYNSPELQNLKLAPKCYRQLNSAKVDPDQLNNFYRFYKLPTNPFFPLFLAVKKEYINNKNRLKENREKKISQQWDKLPKQTLTFFELIHKYESDWNIKSKTPWFYNNIWPHTLKKSTYYSKLSKSEWINFFIEITKQISSYYKKENQVLASYIPLFILDLLNEKEPNEEKIKSAYRLLSKNHHPDRGGEISDFRRVTWAKNQLLD